MRAPSLLRSLAVAVLALGATSDGVAAPLAPSPHHAQGPAPTAAKGPGYAGLGLASVPPAALARYAARPVPALVRRRIQSYLDIRPTGIGMVTTDGRRLFFGWSITGTPQVWRLDTPRGFPVQMTGGEDPTHVYGITPDGKLLVLQRDRNGEENPGLYLQPAAGGALRTIQHKPGVQTAFEFVSDDSRYVYFRANDIKPNSYAIYRYDIAQKSRELLFSEPGIWNVSDHLPDGHLLLTRSTGALTREVFEWDPATRSTKPLLGVGEKEEYQVAYGPQRGDLFVLTPKLGDFRRLYRWRAGAFTPITAEMKKEVDDFSLDRPRRQRLLVKVNDGGFSRVQVFDARNLAALPLPPLPKGDNTWFGSTTRGGRFTTFAVETSVAPRQSYAWDWQARKIAQWVLPNAPEIDTTQFARVSLEAYPARDGTSIPMLVRRPARCAARPCPVVVMFHGGPEGQARPGFSPWAQLFVEEGLVLVEPNIRGSTGYGQRWLHADDGPKRLAIITDIEDCARHLKKTWAEGGRAPRVGVFGGSYGGYLALMAMTRFAGSYDVGVSFVGVSNWISFLKNTAPYRRLLRVSEYGDPDRDREALIKLSPTTYLDRLRAPLLLIQGANDPRVPVGEAIQMQTALEARKVPSELIIIADEGHGAQKRDNQVLWLGHTLAFLRKHLQP